MRNTNNLNLALYDASDKLNITSSTNSLNHNMELIDAEFAKKMSTPSGGTAGQILTKTQSGFAWQNAPAGSGDGGAGSAVLYTAQTLTSEQQDQARTNIDAASSMDVVELKNDISNFEKLNCKNNFNDIFASFRNNNPTYYVTQASGTHKRTHNGITYLWNSDWSSCTVEGTATTMSIANIWYNLTQLPDGFEAGKSVIFKFKSNNENLLLQIGLMKVGSETTEYKYYVSDGDKITLPDDAGGCYIRLRVNEGVTISDCEISNFIFRDSYTNKEVTSIIDESTKRNAPIGKYYAFGDSVTWGAVWGEEQGIHYTQARESYRIPSRIANKIGYKNFENLGISGAGYVKNGGVITSTILSTNLSDATLITVMGGANDKLTINLGTSESAANDGTICGAIKAIIDYVKTNAPKSTLVIIQPTPSGSTSIGINNNIWNGREGGGWSLNDFDREVSKICRNNHVGYVNWKDSIYCDNWKQNSGGYNMDTGPNYSHPKVEEDYCLLGDFIGGKILSLNDNTSRVESYGTPLLTIIDDDGNKHFLSDVVPLIEELNKPISSAVVPTRVGSNVNYMTWDQIHESSDRGAEILCHTYNHHEGSEIASLDEDLITHEYQKGHNILFGKGFHACDIVVYSSSTGNYKKCQRAAEKVFKCGIKIGGSVVNTQKSNKYALARYRIDYASTEGGTDWNLEDMKKWIDACVKSGGWMIWMFHTSNGKYLQRVVCDEDGNPTFNADGTPVLMTDESGEPVYDRNEIGSMYKHVGDVYYLPMLKEAMQYAISNGVDIVTAKYGLKKYFGVE